MASVEDKDGLGFSLSYVGMLLEFLCNSAVLNHKYRKEFFQLSLASLVSSLFPRHHTIPSF